MKSLFRRAGSLFVGATLLAAGSSMASEVVEFGDAGQTQASAQVTAGYLTSLTSIFGSLSSSTDADLYLINILNPGAFSATTVNDTGGFLDTQLFLFSLSGAPVYANDDADGSTVRSTLPAGSSFGPLSAGLYILGISLSGYDPVNAVNQLLFDMSGLTTDVRGPNPSLQPASLVGFFDSTFYDASDNYRIQLTGAGTAVPEPASALLVTLAGALCAATTIRRRRHPQTSSSI